jgi:hypothetical protein
MSEGPPGGRSLLLSRKLLLTDYGIASMDTSNSPSSTDFLVEDVIRFFAAARQVPAIGAGYRSLVTLFAAGYFIVIRAESANKPVAPFSGLSSGLAQSL